MTDQQAEMRAFVLVADDDPAILWLVRTIVESEGFSAVTAMDGRKRSPFLNQEK